MDDQPLYRRSPKEWQEAILQHLAFHGVHADAFTLRVASAALATVVCAALHEAEVDRRRSR